MLEETEMMMMMVADGGLLSHLANTARGTVLYLLTKQYELQ